MKQNDPKPKKKMTNQLEPDQQQIIYSQPNPNLTSRLGSRSDKIGLPDTMQDSNTNSNSHQTKF